MLDYNEDMKIVELIFPEVRFDSPSPCSFFFFFRYSCALGIWNINAEHLTVMAKVFRTSLNSLQEMIQEMITLCVSNLGEY